MQSSHIILALSDLLHPNQSTSLKNTHFPLVHNVKRTTWAGVSSQNAQFLRDKINQKYLDLDGDIKVVILILIT